MADVSIEPIRILVCDDHFLIREGLKAVLSREADMEVVAEADSAEAALDLVAHLLPDVVLMDIVLPGMDGIQATRLIKQNNPSVAVIALTRYDDVEHIMEIYRSGAAAYLAKEVQAQELLSTIRTVAGGSVVLHVRVAQEMLRAFSHTPALSGRAPAPGALPAAGLSARELEVLRWVAQSRSNKEIARELSISVRTVQNHLANIFRKLEINDRISAAIYAIEQGISPTSPGVPAAASRGTPQPRNHRTP
ncbi:MAG TPA: response regulator transcription factor [Chloroflexota bacterium]|nr:response regulator transcription factor [Chloroflexota bacterium]